MLIAVMPFATFDASQKLSDILVYGNTSLSDNILDLYGNVTIDLKAHNIVAGAQIETDKTLAIRVNSGATVSALVMTFIIKKKKSKAKTPCDKAENA